MLHNKLRRDTAGHSAGMFTCQHDFSERVARRSYPWRGLWKRKRKGGFTCLVSSCRLFLVEGGLSHGNNLLCFSKLPHPSPLWVLRMLDPMPCSMVFHPSPKVTWIRHQPRERTDRHGGDCI